MTTAQYAALVAITSKARSMLVAARYAKIARTLGRTGPRAGDQVARAVGGLEAVGALQRGSRTRRGAGCSRFRLARAAGGYDVIPWDLLRAVEAGTVTAPVLRTWAHLDQRMGRLGWTDDDTCTIAAAAGVTPRTLTRHLGQLEGIGLIHRTEGVARVIYRDGAAPFADSHPVENHAPAADTTVDRPDTDAGSADTDAGSHGDLTPDYLSPENYPSSRSARYRGERARDATSGRKRPEGGIYSTPGVSEVRDLLEQMSSWRGRDRAAWLTRILSMAVPYLAAGMTPGAIAYALGERAEDAIDEAIELAQPLVASAKGGMRDVWIDIRLGQACRDCGRAADEAAGPIRDGRCPWCAAEGHPDEDDTAAEEIPAEVLAKVYDHLGVPHTAGQRTVAGSAGDPAGAGVVTADAQITAPVSVDDESAVTGVSAPVQVDAGTGQSAGESTEDPTPIPGDRQLRQHVPAHGIEAGGEAAWHLDPSAVVGTWPGRKGRQHDVGEIDRARLPRPRRRRRPPAPPSRPTDIARPHHLAGVPS